MAEVTADLVSAALDALKVQDKGGIATGGQKAVRLVRNEAGEILVMKVIALSTSSPDALARAEREVTLLAELDSPHVVKVKSELVELDSDGAAWLEEHLDGDDLTALLFDGQWPWSETALMGLHVARGLGAAHERGVVHRDLSANNVRCLSDSTYKVMDFGFARFTLRSGVTIAGQPRASAKSRCRAVTCENVGLASAC